MGLSASQARQLLLDAKRSDLEFRAQQISQQRLVLSSQLEEIARDYEEATSNRQMLLTLNALSPNGDDVIQTKENLTYAALTSGCFGLGNNSPLVATDDALTDRSVSAAYVLRDADGRIVVADPSEIPGYAECMASMDGSWSDAPTYTTNPGYDKSGENFYREAKDDDNGDKYVRVEKDDNSNEYEYVKFDSANSDHANKTQYIMAKSDEAQTKHYTKITIEPMSENIQNKSESYQFIKMVDGELQCSEKYVVDPMLKIGLSDAYGSKTGPNYLQDCLRNGSYLVEKWTPDTNDNTKIKKSGISYDAITGLQDRYYTEDDDAAKAKYDRLTAEIQNKDKKLELELDNIETQRSAITTEAESVQKVMDDNIESTFKTFA